MMGLLFPGQGVQTEGMGEPWRSSVGWQVVQEISECVGVNVADVLLRTPTETLRRTDLAQLAVFTTSMIALAEARAAGAIADGCPCLGHSVGEYAALVAAGALSLADGALLVAARGRAMLHASKFVPGAMAAVVGGDVDAIMELALDVSDAGTPVWVANINSTQQVVLSGTVDGIENAAELACHRGMRAIRLRVGGAFHSPLMQPAADDLEQALAATTFAPFHAPVVANVDAHAYDEDADWRVLLARQLTRTVLFEAAVRTLVEDLQCNRLLELGTGRTLAGLVRRIVPEANVVSVEGPAPLRQSQPPSDRSDRDAPAWHGEAGNLMAATAGQGSG
ncbi:MAG: ACP S-malonyltransferase [Solirubrobacteraceae bacterium]